MSDGKKTPNRLSTPKITNDSKTPTDKNAKISEKLNETKTPRIPLFTFAKGKSHSRPSTPTHKTRTLSKEAKTTPRKMHQETKSSPLRKDANNSSSHSSLGKVSNSKLLFLLRSKTSLGRIESNNSTTASAKTQATIDQAPLLPHAIQQTPNLNTKPEHTIIPISKTRNNNSFLSGVKSLLNKGQIRDHSDGVLSKNMINMPCVFEKSLKEKTTIASATPASYKENKTIESDKLEGGNETVNLIQKAPLSVVLPAPNVDDSDTSRILGNKEPKNFASTKPNITLQDASGTEKSNRESPTKHLKTNFKKPETGDTPNAPPPKFDTSDSTRNQTPKISYPSLKKFNTGEDKSVSTTEIITIPSLAEFVFSAREMKEDADLRRMEILKSPHSSKKSPEKPLGLKDNQDVSTEDEVSDYTASPSKSESDRSGNNSKAPFSAGPEIAENKNDINGSETNGNDKTKEVKIKRPETKITEAYMNKASINEAVGTIRQITHKGPINSGKTVFQSSQKIETDPLQKAFQTNSTIEISSFNPSKRARVEDLLNPSKKNKLNKESFSNTPKGTANPSVHPETQLAIKDASNTKEIINVIDTGKQDILVSSPQSDALRSTQTIIQRDNLQKNVRDPSQAEYTSAKSSVAIKKRDNSKSPPPAHNNKEPAKKKWSSVLDEEGVPEAVESRSLLNLFSNVFKTSLHSKNKSPIGNALHMLGQKPSAPEVAVTTESLGNKSDDMPLSQPVNGSKPEYTNDPQTSLSQPTGAGEAVAQSIKSSLLDLAKDKQIMEEKFNRGRTDTGISHPAKMELIYISDPDKRYSENDSSSDLESLSSRESDEIKVVKDIDTSTGKNQNQTWSDPELEWRRSERELTKNILRSLDDNTKYDKKTMCILIEQGIPRHSHLSNNPLTSVTNNICSVENYETSNAFFYQQVHKRDRLQYLPLYEASTLEESDVVKREDSVNKNTRTEGKNSEQSLTPTKTFQTPTISSPLGFEIINAPINKNGTITKETGVTTHHDISHSKAKNNKENLSKDFWRQEWLANLKLISVSLVDEFPSKTPKSERQTINENMERLKEIFVRKFGSKISKVLTESDIVILKGEIEDFPIDSRVKSLYNDTQNKPGTKKTRFWSYKKTLRFVVNMGIHIHMPQKPISKLALVKPQEVVPQQIIDAKLKPNDKKSQPTKELSSIKHVAAPPPAASKPVRQQQKIANKERLPEKEQIDGKNEERKKVVENGEVEPQNIPLSHLNAVSSGYTNLDKNVATAEDQPDTQSEIITDKNTTDIFSSVDVLKTQSVICSQPANIYTSTQKTEYETKNQDNDIEKLEGEHMDDDGLSFVDNLLSRTELILDEKEKQLVAANEIIQSLSSVIMRDEIKITSLRGDLNFTKKSLKDAKSQISEKDARIQKLMLRVFKKRRG
ncbi:hypothetical protein GRS66_006022 [Saccharomyces pastorianus]|uniref:Sir4 SID domain-containing protein n=1 Tax=Saccharomyces pastorianus TaxID=27292 RepID=A0A6C1E339_SACPS|nr:hypothetical protein GRS66_006022 [Saccharomyces pastorianus]